MRERDESTGLQFLQVFDQIIFVEIAKENKINYCISWLKTSAEYKYLQVPTWLLFVQRDV